MSTELSKTYNPAETEAPWYPAWEKNGYFQPRDSNTPPYAIVIPPPNVTGSLHMGHALNSTLQDILTRWRRMAGDRALWVPGTDHGGIATQNVVEKILRAEKKTRHDLGREAFLERMWQWRKESGDTILMQLRRLGASLEWTRTRFTMDDICSRAVRHAFVKLFEKGLIYRGPRMISWCPRCQTALSDIEVEHEEKNGKLWHIKYSYTDGSGYAVVATTRPETLLGDTAVAVNPKDDRYKAKIGKKLRLPLIGREIPLLTDDAVESEFGTGAVKVTPAHDPTDFEIGERHKLPHEVVIGFDGKMTSKAGLYAGLDRFDARKKIVEDLEAQGLLEKVEDYRLAVAECYRCQTVVEPLVSEQWFLKVGGMATRAAEATRQGRVKIFPESWEKPYLLWLDNIKDWCISRQIWWGHRIPVYYCEEGGEKRARCSPFASVDTPKQCPDCGGTKLRQDNDVLDTWFSSALWPMSVFKWPEETADLKTFYPTAVLVTGHEILYLWVARMVMMGLEFRDEVPFRHVYIHGIVRDKSGKKMSKSLGNVIDPLDIMKQYGTDALRFSLASSSVPGRDMQLSNDSFLKARNFANKLWNVCRFVQMNMEGFKTAPAKPGDLADRWILHELQETITNVSTSLTNYNPGEACRALYDFIWGSFCDWFIEISKTTLTGTDAVARQSKQAVLIHLLDQSLRLLHPFMPFETEQLYQAIRPYLASSRESLMIESWPVAQPALKDEGAARQMRQLQNLVTAVRTVRSEMNIPPGQKIDLKIKSADSQWLALLKNTSVTASIEFLARLNPGIEVVSGKRPPESAFNVFDGGEVYIPLAGLVDKDKERQRLLKNRTQLEELAARGRAMLEKGDFLTRAPKEEVESRKEFLVQTEKKIDWINQNLEALS